MFLCFVVCWRGLFALASLALSSSSFALLAFSSKKTFFILAWLRSYSPTVLHATMWIILGFPVVSNGFVSVIIARSVFRMTVFSLIFVSKVVVWEEQCVIVPSGIMLHCGFNVPRGLWCFTCNRFTCNVFLVKYYCWCFISECNVKTNGNYLTRNARVAKQRRVLWVVGIWTSGRLQLGFVLIVQFGFRVVVPVPYELPKERWVTECCPIWSKFFHFILW